MKNIVIGQSGGPTAAINATLAGVLLKSLEYDEINKIYGMKNGIEGFLSENFVDFSNLIAEGLDINKLITTPAASLGSCRYKLPKDENSEEYKNIFKICEKYNISYFFYIGGNDSMDTIHKLSNLASQMNSDIKFIGIPKTIDNDLPETDHTPGYGSAAKYVATSVLETVYDASVYDRPSVTIIEIMGRHSGWLTAASALAKSKNNQSAPQLIYLPEVAFCKKKFINDIKKLSENTKNIIVAVSEGVRDENNMFLCEDDSCTVDAFGHKQLSGCGKYLENLVKSELGFKARSIELSTLQRSAGHLLSKTDIDESVKIGQKALEYALDGHTGKMVVFKRKSTVPYDIHIVIEDIAKIANIERKLPPNFINEEKNGVTQDFIDYVTPLVSGELYPSYDNGLPVYIYF